MGTIFINGTFDIVHKGHLELFKFARMLASGTGRVVVAIDSDRRVKELKGNNRPINSQEERKLLLEQLIGISKVVVFDSDEELENIIKEEKVSIMVKGTDYVDKPIIGESLVNYVVFIKKTNDSTTNKIQDIIDRR